MKAFDRQTRRHYVCARCWGRIDLCHENGLDVLMCMNPDCNGSGFVSKLYTEKEKNANQFDAMDVKATLRQIGIIDNPNAGKSEDQLLRELGY